MNIVIYYAHIKADGGLPSLLRNLVASILSNAPDLNFQVSDLEVIYPIELENSNLDSIALGKPFAYTDEVRPDVAIFIPWPIRYELFRLAWRLRRKGSTIIVWPWGQFCVQQSKANWNQGHTPLWVKWLGVKLLRLFWLRIADFFFIFSDAEREDSRLPRSRSVEVILPGLNTPTIQSSSDLKKSETGTGCHGQCLAYFGRGLWIEKGIDRIIHLAVMPAGEALQWHFFISDFNKEFEINASRIRHPNVHWHFDVEGAALLPWLRSSIAVITLSPCPVPLRSMYEALYAGVPIITSRETYMDGIKRWLMKQGLGEAVQLLTWPHVSAFDSMIRSVEGVDREALRQAVQHLLNSGVFARWLAAWLRNPQGDCSYFDHI